MEKSEEKIINQLTSEFNLRPEQVTNGQIGESNP